MTKLTPATLVDIAYQKASEVKGAVPIFSLFQGDDAPVFTQELLTLGAPLIELIQDVYARGIFRADVGQTFLIPPCESLPLGALLVGFGKADEFDRENAAKALSSALNAVAPWAESVTLVASSWRPNQVDEKLAGFWLTYTAMHSLIKRTHLKTSDDTPVALKTLYWVDGTLGKAFKAGLEEGKATAYGMLLSRFWADLPPNICTPAFLADQVKTLAKDFKSLEVSVWDKKEIKAKKMGAFLAVAQGSEVEPRFIVVRYHGADDPNEAPIALIGKGITFDTGGISLKPAANMADMIYDMSGAATVLGSVFAAAKLGLKKNVMAVVAACENMPSGSATKPGDVVTSYSGKTIEILNTDAEGRLILADALSWTAEQKPAAMVDVATLTGACCIALGSPYSGLFSTDDSVREALRVAGDNAGDEAWPMPVTKAYERLMKSNAADIANMATQRDGGASSAAAFLAVFNGGLPWAHLDVAATANTSGRDHVSTGRPVPLLTRFLFDWSKQ